MLLDIRMMLSFGGMWVLFLYLGANYRTVFSLCTFLDVYYISKNSEN